MNFSEKLIELRRKEGLSQEQLGYKVNVSRQTVSKWELGETTPELEKLLEISKVFDISIDDLVGNSKNNHVYDYLYYRRFRLHYEFQSKTTIKGVPLVHINVGYGLRKAKGIIAIGNIAQGVLSIGFFSLGILSIGCLALGIVSVAGLAFALLLALGGAAIGGIAIGGVAIGIVAFGGLAVGVYSIGGAAIASNVARGGYASAHIAIGDQTSGDILFHTNNAISSRELEKVILQEFPKTPRILIDLFKMMI